MNGESGDKKDITGNIGTELIKLVVWKVQSILIKRLKSPPLRTPEKYISGQGVGSYNLFKKYINGYMLAVLDIKGYT